MRSAAGARSPAVAERDGEGAESGHQVLQDQGAAGSEDRGEREKRNPDNAKHGPGTVPGRGGKIKDHEVDGVLANNRLLL